MAESTLIDYTKDGMKRHWRGGVKHADAFTPGIADLSGYILGCGTVWIECKSLDKWPSRSTTVVRLSRFTDEQRLFLWERHGFLFLRVAREYLLFGWLDAYERCGRVLRTELQGRALKAWKGSVDWAEFTEVIRNACPNAG